MPAYAGVLVGKPEQSVTYLFPIRQPLGQKKPHLEPKRRIILPESWLPLPATAVDLPLSGSRRASKCPVLLQHPYTTFLQRHESVGASAIILHSVLFPSWQQLSSKSYVTTLATVKRFVDDLATKFRDVATAVTIGLVVFWYFSRIQPLGVIGLTEKVNVWFSRRLEALLEERGYRKADLARDLKVERSTITRYSQGRIPDAETLDRIARLFSVSTDYLLGRTDDPHGTADPDAANALPEDEELIVVFRGRRQDLSPNYKKALIALLEEAHRKMEEEEK